MCVHRNSTAQHSTALRAPGSCQAPLHHCSAERTANPGGCVPDPHRLGYNWRRERVVQKQYQNLLRSLHDAETVSGGRCTSVGGPCSRHHQQTTAGACTQTRHRQSQTAACQGVTVRVQACDKAKTQNRAGGKTGLPGSRHPHRQTHTHMWHAHTHTHTHLARTHAHTQAHRQGLGARTHSRRRNQTVRLLLC